MITQLCASFFRRTYNPERQHRVYACGRRAYPDVWRRNGRGRLPGRRLRGLTVKDRRDCGRDLQLSHADHFSMTITFDRHTTSRVPGPNTSWRGAPTAGSSGYATYYNQTRAHLALQKHAPCIEPSNDLAPLSPFRSWLGCITNSSGPTNIALRRVPPRLRKCSYWTNSGVRRETGKE